MGADDNSDHANPNNKQDQPFHGRYNKIQHQYRLTDEDGPAHKKTFTVILQLGEEEYQATGPSIKKAQHAAASSALQATKFKHPPPKQQRSSRTSEREREEGLCDGLWRERGSGWEALRGDFQSCYGVQMKSSEMENRYASMIIDTTISENRHKTVSTK